jgi:TonB family protein
MRLSVVLRGLVAFAAGLAISTPAFGDLKSYNAAVVRGDFPAAAAEAQTIWSTFDKTRADAVVTAREFAWTSMLAGQRDKAKVYATWLVDEAPRLGAANDDPLMSNVLLRWSELGEQPSPASAEALAEALGEWANASPVASRVAAFAAVQLYSRQWNAGRWKEVQHTALLAANVSARLGVEGAGFEERARIDGAAAQFLNDKKIDAWFALADAHDGLMARMGPPVAGEEMDELEAIDMRAHAWLEAMGAYFATGGDSSNTSMSWKRQYATLEARRKTLKSRCGDAPCPDAVVPGETPKCAATWDQSPALRYPQVAVFRGLVGATILQMTTDEAGEVTDAKVLAAVPSETFPEATLKTVKKWKLKPSDKATQPCTLAGTRDLHVTFRFP